MYGRALLKHGATVFDELRQSVKEIEFLSDPTIGELRIGATAATAAGLLSAIIGRLHRQYPKLVFHTTQGTSGASFYRELRERNVELILARTTRSLAEPDLVVERLMEDPLVVVAGRRSEWQRRRKIALADLINEPWLLPAPNSAASAIIDDTFQACGLVPPQGAVRSQSLQMYSILQASGPYLAMWPSSVTRLGAIQASVKVLPVKLPVIRRPVSIITLKGRTVSPLVKLFTDCARKTAKQLEG
jgi:DNA-binding transcriptional LysR family regulator